MTPLARNSVTLAVFSAVALIYTWPLVLHPASMALLRHFDLFGALWLLDVASSVDGHLVTTMASWPLGKELLLADSWLLLLLGRLSPSWLAPNAVASLFTMVGPVLSAWAAERLAARGLGARWPWSLMAGLAYAFSGSALAALLEGRVYVLLNPWLPLMALQILLAAGPRGGTRHGLAAGFFWVLCLLTSAYQGIVASVMLSALLACHLRRIFRRPRPWAALACLIIPAGLGYSSMILKSTARTFPQAAAYAPIQDMQSGSASLASMAAWTPDADLQNHSSTPLLGFTVLVLAMFTPLLLWRKGSHKSDPVAATALGRRLGKAPGAGHVRPDGPTSAKAGRGESAPGRGSRSIANRKRTWVCFLGIAVVAMLLSLGPTLRVISGDQGIPWLLWPLANSHVGTWFRFPVRLLWLTHLGLGTVAALGASELARRRPRLAAPLLAFCLADVLLASGVTRRTVQVPISVPSAYRQVRQEGALLDLFADFRGYSMDVGHYITDISCTYQRLHRRPLLNACLQPLVPMGPQVAVQQLLRNKLLSPESGPGVFSTLAELGVTTLVVHPDTFPTEQQEQLLSALEDQLGPPEASSRDGGEYVVAFDIQGEADDPLRAYSRILQEGWGW